MLLTDLPSIADGLLARNVAANIETGEGTSTLGTSTSNQTLPGAGSSAPWPGARRCGAGSVQVAALDFCRPLSTQGSKQGCNPLSAETVLAIDIVWLKELVAPLAHTISDILHAPMCQGPAAQIQAASNTPIAGMGQDDTAGQGAPRAGLMDGQAQVRG